MLSNLISFGGIVATIVLILSIVSFFVFSAECIKRFRNNRPLLMVGNFILAIISIACGAFYFGALYSLATTEQALANETKHIIPLDVADCENEAKALKDCLKENNGGQK